MGQRFKSAGASAATAIERLVERTAPASAVAAPQRSRRDGGGPARLAVDGGAGRRPGRRPPRGRHAPRHAGQPPVGGDRRRPRHLHAGRLRPRRDRLLPGQARRPRGEHELRHLRPRVRGLLLRRVPAGVRRLLVRVADRPRHARRRQPARLGQLGVPVEGRLGAVRRRHHPRRCSASSSTWWRSWTPSPRSRPARWPSAGSGRASSAGACSAAPSTTRCSRPGRGAAAGWPRPGTR